MTALQVNGRAPWSRVAAVLGTPERTVTRNGAELLRSGRVAVAGLGRADHQVILRCGTVPGADTLVCASLAQRDDVTYCYQTSGEDSIVAEVQYQQSLGELLAVHVPTIPGLRKIGAFPVLKYFKTIRAWRGEALTEAEVQALSQREAPRQTPRPAASPAPLGGADSPTPVSGGIETRAPHDNALIDALHRDGRRSLESLARLLKMSESSVARRIDWLLSSGHLSIRAVVEPADMGYAVEAMLWVRVAPGDVESLGRHLQQWPQVRYAAAIAGSEQLLVNVTVRTHAELYTLLTNPTWAAHHASVRTDLVHTAHKRGGRILTRGGATSYSAPAPS